DAAAAERYLAAADAFRAAGHLVDEFRNRRQHAISMMWANDIEGAVAALATADELGLSLPGDDNGRWERAMVLYDGARILRTAHRPGEASLRAASSAAAFRELGLPVQSAYAEILHAELLLHRGRPADAEAAVRRAMAELPAEENGHDRLRLLLDAA